LAVKTACRLCHKPFSAPEEYLGKKVDCPRCGHRSVLRTQEELQAIEERERELERHQEDDRRRLALIERQMERARALQGAQPYFEKFLTGTRPVRHYSPNTPSRFLRLRALSDPLLMAAWLSVMLVLLGAGLSIYLAVHGTLPSLSVLLLCLVGWSLLGTFLFFGFKCLGELAFLLADLGDQQNDLVQLLLDLRDNSDRFLPPVGPGELSAARSSHPPVPPEGGSSHPPVPPEGGSSHPPVPPEGGSSHPPVTPEGGCQASS
jgi:DNA-directed RNA polymerase subunit RPC12/RpoP